ncbi:MAG TPA: Rieske (2Fe-2S) protein, partial [Terriglobales bacterium]|nr:Rieske (2Fe-2S) protein [Terriglobales bacterium]
MGDAKRPSWNDKALQDVRNSLSKARHMPGHLYVAPEIFQLELDKIFLKDWQVVGRAEQFPNPGDFHAFRLFGEPVLLVRNANGMVQAFTNVCRHRGAEIASGRGNRKQLECPYHKWLYDLDGKLIAAPMSEHGSDFDFNS